MTASSSRLTALTLSRCVEKPSDYLLLVQWQTLEDHTVGFRQSAEYQRWRDAHDPAQQLSDLIMEKYRR